MNPHAAIGLICRLIGLAQTEEIDLVPRGQEDVRLAADAGVAGVDGMDHDRHAAHADVTFTSFQSASFSSAESSARTWPRSAASRSTRS